MKVLTDDGLSYLCDKLNMTLSELKQKLTDLDWYEESGEEKVAVS